MSNRFGLLLLLFITFIGCSENPERPPQLIPEDEYIDLLVELQLVRSYTTEMRSDSATVDSLTQAVFRKYDVSGEVFSQSHTYYQKFPKEQQERIDKAIERLKMDRVEDTTETGGRPEHTKPGYQ